MRVSKAGLGLASAYLVLSLLSIACGYSFNDPDAGLIFLQLPFVPLLWLVLLWSVFTEPKLPDLPWPLAFALGLPVVAAVFYDIGAVIGRIEPRIRLALGCAALVIVLAALF